MTEMVQEEARMEMVGVVVAPPMRSEIMLRLLDAADRKESLTLSPGECRVLAGLLV